MTTTTVVIAEESLAALNKLSDAIEGLTAVNSRVEHSLQIIAESQLRSAEANMATANLSQRGAEALERMAMTAAASKKKGKRDG